MDNVWPFLMNSCIHVWSETASCICHSDSLCVTFTCLIVPLVSFSKTLTQSLATIEFLLESLKDTLFSFLNPGFMLVVETSPSVLFSPFSPEEEHEPEGEDSRISCNSFDLFRPPNTGGSWFPFY